MDEPKPRPGTEDGYNVQRNIEDALMEFELMRDFLETVNTYVMRWERKEAKDAWHHIVMALWRIENSTKDARDRVYRTRQERRRGDTGPLNRRRKD